MQSIDSIEAYSYGQGKILHAIKKKLNALV